MRPLGMEGTKKLSDLLVDEKVPQQAPRAHSGRARRGRVWCGWPVSG